MDRQLDLLDLLVNRPSTQTRIIHTCMHTHTHRHTQYPERVMRWERSVMLLNDACAV